MSLPPRLFAAAFHEQRLGLILTLIVGVMIYLGTLALGAQAFLSGTLLAWGQATQAQFTLEIPFQSDLSTEQRDQRLSLVADAVRALPFVQDLAVVPRGETIKLLKPWLDDPLLLAALPLPSLIDGTLVPDGAPDWALLRARCEKIVAGVRVEVHADWMRKLVDVIAFGTWLMSGLIVLIALALVVAIVLVCKVAFASQHATIDLLHVMGATDRDIAAQFRTKIARLAWPPAFLGYAVALLSLAGLAWFLASFFDLGLSQGLSRYAVYAAVLALVPLLGVIVSIVTAHVSVLRLLRRRGR